MSEKVLVPSRPPDLTLPHGTMLWWCEMVRVSPHGEIGSMMYDSDNGDLDLLNPDGSVYKTFHNDIRDEYLKWLYTSFEDAILTASENEHTAR